MPSGVDSPAPEAPDMDLTERVTDVAQGSKGAPLSPSSPDATRALTPWALPAGDPPPLSDVIYTMRPEGAAIYHNPTLGDIDWDQVLELLSDPYLFPSTCQIVREDDSVGFLELTRFQKWMLWSIHENRWVMVDKFRQAMATTVYVLWLLRDCMYLEGMQGVLIACDEGTAKMAFDRLKFAYQRLPDAVKIPLMPGVKGSATELKFIHGGGIKIISAGSTAPAVGHSVGRMVITEWGEARWQKKAAINLFPTIYRRPHGRLVLESTPGRAGTQHQTMWYEALKGMGWFTPDKGDGEEGEITEGGGDEETSEAPPTDIVGAPLFFPLFLEWWHQFGSEHWVPPDFTPDAVEQKLLERCHGITHGNLMFRRTIMRTLFMGDPRLFEAKYPTDPFSGWLGSLNPKLPEEPLRKLMMTAVMDHAAPLDSVVGCHVITPPSSGWALYMITADPAGFGELTGDPSAFIVWDVFTWTEVAFWEGREDPDVFAERLMRVQEFYSTRRPAHGEQWGGINAQALLAGDLRDQSKGSVIEEPSLLAVESNKGECIAALRVMGARSLYWTTKRHCGWYATEKSLRNAESHTVVGLREEELKPRSFGTIQQCLTYDGTRRDRRVKSDDGEGGHHHFDRARCVIIAGDLLRLQSNLVAAIERKIRKINESLGLIQEDGLLVREDGSQLGLQPWQPQEELDSLDASATVSIQALDKRFGRKKYRWNEQ